jgi:anthranilate/para-aminobenzoate synthase component II
MQYLGELGADFVVYKNDEKTVDEIRALNPAGILVSPGPGAAQEGGRDGGGVGTQLVVVVVQAAHMRS